MRTFKSALGTALIFVGTMLALPGAFIGYLGCKLLEEKMVVENIADAERAKRL